MSSLHLYSWGLGLGLLYTQTAAVSVRYVMPRLMYTQALLGQTHPPATIMLSPLKLSTW